MTSRERIETTLAHKEPDVLPMDFGAGFQTGIAVSVVYELRQRLGLDDPGTPVKVVEPYQMLGEVKPDLSDALGLDCVMLAGTGTLFGFPQKDWKEWTTPDGTPVLVAGLFNTDPEPNGDIFQYPEGDKSLEPCGNMPSGGYFFDAIVRQDPIDEEKLDPKDNLEEFSVISDEELEHYRTLADRLYSETDRALFCTAGGLSFGDIALVPATWLRHPKGIRDIEEWYISTIMRPDYIKAVFEGQCEIALENLKRLYDAVGDKVAVIQTNGTDFGTQNGPFISPDQYRDMYLPYQRRLHDWIHENTPWKAFMHSCGGIYPLLDCVVDAGFDILNPVQCSATDMEPERLKKEYGDKLVFWGGGVDTQKTLPFGTPDEVREEVKRRIEVLGEGGGFVFCSIHNVVANVPIDNLLAMFEVVKEYR